MTYALVGVKGGIASGAGTASPAYGQTPTAGNLLILWVSGDQVATLPTAPSGWSTAIQQAGLFTSASIFYKIAAGGDAAPGVISITGATVIAELAEFSGNATSAPVDQTGSAAGTTSPQAATLAAADAAVGELLVSAVAAAYASTGTAAANAMTLTSGSSGALVKAVETNNTGTNTTAHYAFSAAVGTNNTSADKASMALTTTNLSGAAVAAASFLLPAPAGIPDVNMAVQRAG